MIQRRNLSWSVEADRGFPSPINIENDLSLIALKPWNTNKNYIIGSRKLQSFCAPPPCKISDTMTVRGLEDKLTGGISEKRLFTSQSGLLGSALLIPGFPIASRFLLSVICLWCCGINLPQGITRLWESVLLMDLWVVKLHKWLIAGSLK